MGWDATLLHTIKNLFGDRGCLGLYAQPQRLKHICPLLVFLVVFSLANTCGFFTERADAASTGWTTNGTDIVSPSGSNFLITGINWYGFETTGYVAHGLYAQDYTHIVNVIKTYGYNTIRIPFSNQMWESDPVPAHNTISACPSCKGKHARDILALIVNYAGSLGLHVILDNHRSEAGNSAEKNGLWYVVSGSNNYPESSWINDWISAQQWTHGTIQTLGSTDTITVNYLAADGMPTVIGFDLRNEPHTPARTAYLQGATWGTGDGINPSTNPNPNPFAVSCVTNSSCHDWRLAAERAGDSIFADADAKGWSYPLIFVEGISAYPTATGNAQNGPYDNYWWGGNLLGVNGNANNPGAPIVFNSGGNSSSLGKPVSNQLVYSAHDFGPAVFQQSWFNSQTCYTTHCSSSSLSDTWHKFWMYTNLSSGIAPVWSNQPYPWANTNSTAYTQTPVYIGEAGTGNNNSDLFTTGPGSEGQWFTDLVNLIQSSYTPTTGNNSGYAVTNLSWSYWAVNGEDSDALLGSNYIGLANPDKEYSFLCFIQQPPAAQCGSTGPLPPPT